MILDSTMEPLLPMLQAIGKIPGGVFIMTTGKAGDPDAMGMMVSFVQQMSMEPLYIAVGVKKGRAIGEMLQKNLAQQMSAGGPRPRFVLNITHAGDKTLLRKYAKSAVYGAAAFEGVRSQTLPTGSTTLLDACAYVECELNHVLDFGADHDLFLGVPLSGELLGDGTLKPAVHIRHDASKY